MNAILRITLILLFLSATLASDYDSVQVEHVQDRPDGFDLRIKTFGQQYNLKLKQQPSALSENLKIISINNGRVEETSYQGEIPKLFVDSETRTVLHVNKSEDNLKLEGVLSPDISLLPTQGIRTDEPAKAFRKTKQESVFSCKAASTPMMTPQQYNRQANLPVPNTVQPELFVIVDYKNFKEIDFNLNKLVKYLSVMWTSVNEFFADIKNPGIKLVVTKIFPIKDLQDQPFIQEFLRNHLSKQILDDDKSIEEINRYKFKEIEDDYDIGMLMTAEDLASYDNDSGVYDDLTLGIAFTGGACQKYDSNIEIGITEDKFPYFTGQLTLVHEVAHQLGVMHDGDGPLWTMPGHPGAADCSEYDGYIMSSTLSYNTETMNHLRWSHCSVKQIHWFINQESAICLRNKPGSSVIDESHQLPGEVVSLDKQCQSLYGKSFKFDKLGLSEVCASLKCVSGNWWETMAEHPALEGSPCNERGNKRCRRGKCNQHKDFY